MRLRCIAAAAALFLLSAAERERASPDVLEVFATWDVKAPVQLLEESSPEGTRRHELQHARRNISLDNLNNLAAIPIAKNCEIPGYTGQFCEFPVCSVQSDFVSPSQFEDGDGIYPIDAASLGQCDKIHTTIIDDSLSEVIIKVVADGRVNPSLAVTNAGGVISIPSRVQATQNSFQATFVNLPPGLYVTTPTADANNANCRIIINARTDLTISAGFTTGNDRDQSDFGRVNALDGEPNTLVLHANKNLSPAFLRSVMIYAPGNMLIAPKQLSIRYGCSYEYFFDALTCPVSGAYTAIVEGVDHSGFIFRRAAAFHCLLSPHTMPSAAPITTPTNPTSCSNGGVLVKNADGSTYCVCQDLWEGVTCSVAQCANGGTQTVKGGCLCRIGYSGRHCSDVLCSEDAGDGFEVDRPTLVLVIRLRQQMSDVILQVRDAVLSVYSDLLFEPSYFTRFALVLFNNDQIYQVKTFSSVELLSAELFKASIAAHSDGNCTDAVFGATATALTQLGITNKSPVYIFTDALPDDYDSDLETVFYLDSYWRAPLNFIYVQPVKTDFCSPDEDSPSFLALDGIAARTSGLALFIRNASAVQDVLYNHMRQTVYRTQLLLSGDRLFCTSSGNLFKTVSVDAKVDNIVIVGKGKNLVLYMTDPDNRAAAAKLIFQSDDFFIWKVQGPALGNYYFSVATTPAQTFCAFRVYQGSALSLRTRPPGDLFWGFTEDLQQDSFSRQPVVGLESSPVFHLNNYPVRNPSRVFSALNIYAYRGDSEFELYASNGLWRDGCSYNFYFPPFRCNKQNEVLHFNFFARDEIGFYIQRAGAMYCNQYHTPPTQPTGCQNGGVPGGANGTCICQPFFTGDNCDRILCANGGTSTRDHCSCTAGFAGKFCEFPSCPVKGPQPNFGFGIDMIFVIETTKQSQSQVKYLSKYMTEILRDIHDQHPQWINNVILATFDSKQGGVKVVAPAFNYQPIIDVVNQIAASNLTDDGCIVKTWTALHEAMNQRSERIRRKSIVNVFQTSIPDNVGNIIQAALVSEELRAQQVLLNVWQTYLWDPNTNGYLCNANDSDFEMLARAAARSDGHLYSMHASLTVDAARLVSSFYSSSVIYQRSFTDCQSPQFVYFPVDAYTQTFQIIARGWNPTIQLFKADGTELTSNVIEFADDTEAGWKILEYRNPCEEEWEEVSQTCIRFDLQKKQAAAAVAFCGSLGGYLVDDLSADKHKFLKNSLARKPTWLGLKLTNGEWRFDHGNESIPVNTASTFWKNGVTPNDPAKPCAYIDANWNWVADDCTGQYGVVCQKKEGQNTQVPGRIGDDDISPGKYYLTIQSDVKPPAFFTLGNSCLVEIRGQSGVVIDSGFNENLHGDEAESSANIDSRANYIVTALSVVGNTQLAYMTHTLLYSFAPLDTTLLEAATYLPRFGCSYEWVSQPLTCEETNGDDFSILHVGVDNAGNTFQRLTTGVCEKPFLVCGPDSFLHEGRCVCPDYFTGVSCRVPVCQNGGTLNDDERTCKCPSGYSGKACQFVSCSAKSNSTFSNNGKTLAFLIEATLANRDALYALVDSFETIVAAVTKDHALWIDSYAISAFTADNSTFATYNYHDAEDALEKLKEFADDASDAGGPEMPIYEALTKILKIGFHMNGAEMVIVTQSAPLPNDIQNALLAYAEFGVHNPKVSYVYTTATGVDSTAPAFSHLVDFAVGSGGVYLRATPASLGKLLTAVLPTLYASASIEYKKTTNCQFTTYIQVDVNVTDVFISAAASNPSIKVTGPLDQQVTQTLFKDEKQAFYSYQPTTPGTHKIEITAAGQCYVSSWTVGGVQVLIGFVQEDPSSDNEKPYAVAGARNYPVYRIIDPGASGFQRARLFYSNMWSVYADMDTASAPSYLSELDSREGCVYQYVSRPFTCDLDKAIDFFVTGSDNYGQTFVRPSFTFCLTRNGAPNYQSTISPGPTDSTVTAPVTTTTASLPSLPTESTVSIPTDTSPIVPTTPAVSTTTGPPGDNIEPTTTGAALLTHSLALLSLFITILYAF